MLRRLPLLSFILAGFVIPLSCSSDDDPASAPGGDTPTGGGNGESIDVDTGMGGESSTTPACQEFVGLGNCGSDAMTAETTPVNMLLVLDKSGSMATPPESGSDVSLWDSTRSALSEALSDAPAAVSFGLQMYPAQALTLNCVGNCCDMPEGQDLDVPIGAGEDARADIVRMLNRTAPGGGTPTADALARAFQYFSTGDGADLDGDRFVLLATDGGPNCNSGAECGIETCTINLDNPDETQEVNRCANNPAGCLDDEETLGQIELLRSIGVDTFVVGLPGTEQYADPLDQFAEAGGRPREGTPEKYFKVDAEGSAQGLAEVLKEITTQLVQSCDIRLAEAPPDPARVNVAVNCDIVPWGSAPGEPTNGGEGGQGGAVSTDVDESSSESFWWMDESTSPPTIRLGGEVCETIQSQGVDRIDVVLGCPTVR